VPQLPLGSDDDARQRSAADHPQDRRVIGAVGPQIASSSRNAEKINVLGEICCAY
jgi:hypothetical protein